VLILVCAGPNSLHPDWPISQDEDASATLGVVWYGKETPDERFISQAEKVLYREGPKWALIRNALKELFPTWREDYDFIWLPDDDISFAAGTVGDLVKVMYKFRLDLAQPCLSDKNITCPAYRSVLLRSGNKNVVFHRTNFVEIMCPMFSVYALDKVFTSTIDDERCCSGWGLDSIWPSLLPQDSVAIIDVVEVEHTRPPNSFSSNATWYKGLDPRREELDLMARFRVAPYSKRILEFVEQSSE